MMLYSCTHMATVGVKGLTQFKGYPENKLRPQARDPFAIAHNTVLCAIANGSYTLPKYRQDRVFVARIIPQTPPSRDVYTTYRT